VSVAAERTCGICGICESWHPRTGCDKWTPVESEPQVGAQVPSQALQDYWRCFHCDFFTTSREEAEAHFGERDDAEEFKPICKWWANMDDGERRETLQDAIREWRAEQEENSKLREAFNRIKSYATEAAKTPIAREDMHDPLKAQTFYDETQGLYRLILSEAGSSR
jgi:hypothetical protein